MAFEKLRMYSLQYTTPGHAGPSSGMDGLDALKGKHCPPSGKRLIN